MSKKGKLEGLWEIQHEVVRVPGQQWQHTDIWHRSRCPNVSRFCHFTECSQKGKSWVLSFNIDSCFDIVCWSWNMPSKPNTRSQRNIKSLLSMEGNVWLPSGESAATVLALLSSITLFVCFVFSAVFVVLIFCLWFLGNKPNIPVQQRDDLVGSGSNNPQNHILHWEWDSG